MSPFDDTVSRLMAIMCPEGHDPEELATVEFALKNSPLAAELATLRAERDELRKCLADLLRIQSTVEVLGEWSALDMNRNLSKTTRARVDEITARAFAALPKYEPKTKAP